MIIELAQLTIEPGKAEEFEANVLKARPLFERAKGCSGASIQPITEIDGGYMLVVKWETLENHMVDFRESEDFQTWRGLVGKFFTKAPHGRSS